MKNWIRRFALLAVIGSVVGGIVMAGCTDQAGTGDEDNPTIDESAPPVEGEEAPAPEEEAPIEEAPAPEAE